MSFASLALTMMESTRPIRARDSARDRRSTVTAVVVASVVTFLAAFAGSLTAAATGSGAASIAIAGLSFVVLFPLIWVDERSR